MAHKPIPTFSFVVEGSGQFPLDMLRYDQCWPMSSRDAGLIEQSVRGRRRVTLQTFGDEGLRPTVGRWDSFTWRVIPNTDLVL